jgi:hypothetical protein
MDTQPQEVNSTYLKRDTSQGKDKPDYYQNNGNKAERKRKIAGLETGRNRVFELPIQ